MGDKKRVFGDPNNNRKSNSVLLERCFRLLEYLSHNTDSEHTITQAELRRDEEISEYLGAKDSFNKMMQNLTLAINTDSAGGIKPEEDWRLVYKAFSKCYGENGSDDDPDGTEGDPRFIKDIYYSHSFTWDEITEMINALRMSKTADNKVSERIIKKIKKELVSKHYTEYSCRIHNGEYTDSQLLYDNLSLIQRAISLRRQISYRMNYYDRTKRLVPVRKTETVISPHYIVTNAGRFYAIGCFEGKEKTMCIIRIDLMSDVTILSKTVTPKKDICGLPQMMKEEFKSLQLNMSYDKPIPVTMRITKKLEDKNTNTTVINHTFILDTFGSSYLVLSSDDSGDIIRVMCPPFAIKNFAMQYSDVVEVLTPENLRNEIKDKIKKLGEKYGC